MSKLELRRALRSYLRRWQRARVRNDLLAFMHACGVKLLPHQEQMLKLIKSSGNLIMAPRYGKRILAQHVNLSYFRRCVE